eukprot:Seg2006.1 transcript_id=Seg2006.1/GoldUCD/mRNA.D3Y31 product="hypothetical protein" protein_id=Seg2006.1/GoldUCD/D3Y31
MPSDRLWGSTLTKSSLEIDDINKTSNVGKGSLSYMAPEILPGKRLISRASQQDLMRCDIWSLGMVLFSLINPSVTPFENEVNDSPYFNPARADEFLANMFDKERKPKMSEEYDNHRALHWSPLLLAYEMCTKFDAEERPCLVDGGNALKSILRNDFAQVIKLNVSQMSALENFDKQYAQGQTDIPFPENDGTRCCSFLCYKIASDLFARKKPLELISGIKRVVENVIENYPSKIN